MHCITRPRRPNGSKRHSQEVRKQLHAVILSAHHVSGEYSPPKSCQRYSIYCRCLEACCPPALLVLSKARCRRHGGGGPTYM